jgi:hypothetical protein
VADKAGKAAPAMAIAGVMVAAPQAHASVRLPAAAATVIEQVHTDAAVRQDQADRTYTVHTGDTLSSIAQRFYGNPADWRAIYQANSAKVHNPNLIYQGEVLDIPNDPPAAPVAPAVPAATAATTTTLHGTLSCAGLEELWEDAGGAQGEAFMAAEIAMAESSGQQFATGTVGERGYWQINPNHGSLSTYDPLGNAKAAVIISDDGTNWTPWTTYTSGLYIGRC